MRRGSRVEAVELSRRFGPHLALDRLNLSVEPGETFGLLGSNGAGKTTFIRLVTGFLVPTSGSVRVDSFSPVEHPDEVHARLGYVPETSHLYPELRVIDFLRFAGGARCLGGERLEAAIDETLEHFDLGGVRRRLIGNLSKGFQQRVSLSQAFLHDPELVIVDEPTSGLDPVQQAEVRQLIAGLRGRCTVLLCTHDLSEARALTSRVAVLAQGTLVAYGRTEEILERDDPHALFRARADTALPEEAS